MAHNRGLSLIAPAFIAATLGLAGCQVLGAVTGEDEGAIMRGRDLAQQRCASCHALGRGASPRAGAPTFADIGRRYSAPALLRELEASAAVGHYGMPPTPTTAADRDDLVAYLRSSQPPSASR